MTSRASTLIGEEAEEPRRDQLPEIIETPRLLLRRWRLADVDDVFTYARDEEWSRYLHLLPRPYTRRHAEEFVARQVLFDWETNPAWAIEHEGRAIGGVTLRLLFDRAIGELGYSIARPYWSQGMVSEVAGALIDVAFTRIPQLIRVRAFADARNGASQRVMMKVGMVGEGVLRQNRIERGEAIDEAWYGILREEWRPVAG